MAVGCAPGVQLQRGERQAHGDGRVGLHLQALVVEALGQVQVLHIGMSMSVCMHVLLQHPKPCSLAAYSAHTCMHAYKAILACMQ